MIIFLFKFANSDKSILYVHFAFDQRDSRSVLKLEASQTDLFFQRMHILIKWQIIYNSLICGEHQVKRNQLFLRLGAHKP